MQIKKPAWKEMPVLDVRALPDGAVQYLADAYNELCNEELKALAKLNVDDARAKIDKVISFVLGAPDMAPLRSLLAREPGLTGKGLSPKPGQAELFPEKKKEKSSPAQLQLL